MTEMIGAEVRVCVRCGQPAAQHAFCPNCGLNLAAEPELPTRGEWEASNPSDKLRRDPHEPVLAPTSANPLADDIREAPALTQASRGAAAVAPPTNDGPSLMGPGAAVAPSPVGGRPAALFARVEQIIRSRSAADRRKIYAGAGVAAIAVAALIAVAASGSGGSSSGCADVSALDAATNRLQNDATGGNATAAVGDAQEAANDINSVENDITSSSQSLQAQLAIALGYLQTAASGLSRK